MGVGCCWRWRRSHYNAQDMGLRCGHCPKNPRHLANSRSIVHLCRWRQTRRAHLYQDKDCCDRGWYTAFTQDRGFSFNGTTQWLNTNFNPVANGVNYTLNSAHIALWDNTNRGVVTSTQIGHYDGVNVADLHVYLNLGVTGCAIRMNDATLLTATNTSSLGLFLGQRISSSAVEVYYNGSALSG